jgi:hypothetical protein
VCEAESRRVDLPCALHPIGAVSSSGEGWIGLRGSQRTLQALEAAPQGELASFVCWPRVSKGSASQHGSLCGSQFLLAVSGAGGPVPLNSILASVRAGVQLAEGPQGPGGVGERDDHKAAEGAAAQFEVELLKSE